jgi:hypothetical protein
MPECITEWATEYRRRGLAVCRVSPGEKRPTYKDWTLKSLEPGDFGPDDSIGIISGRLSGDLVCVDIDYFEALAEADRFLPGTGMEEGRPGKPRSHRWFRVTDIPPEWTAPTTCAGGMGGPRTTQFARGREAGGMVVEFRGTGTQAVVPASMWTSQDGTQQERRLWHSFGEPVVLGHLELLGAVARFAAAFGGRNSRWEDASRPPTPRRQAKKNVVAPDLMDLPAGDVAQRARAYLRKVSPAVEGQGGDRHTFFVACLLVRDFDLPVDDALALMVEWNTRCLPPWRVEDLVRKLEAAEALDGPLGTKLRPRSSRTIEVNLLPGDREILVGVDCAKADVSYVNLAPDMWAAMLKHGHTFGLASELEAIDWAGKVVTLATPSNVSTNKKVVYDEFRLAYALRERGAEVLALRIRSSNGRRLTLSQAEDVEVVTPPLTAREVEDAAQAASQKALEQAGVRRSLSRNKTSVKLEQAVNWLKKRNAQEVTKDLVRKAKRKGLSQRTLFRAMRKINLTEERVYTPHPPSDSE